MIAHVIMLNDGIMGVVIDSEAYASQRQEELALEYYKKNFHGELYSDYRRRCIWHMTSIKITEHPFAKMPAAVWSGDNLVVVGDGDHISIRRLIQHWDAHRNRNEFITCPECDHSFEPEDGS